MIEPDGTGSGGAGTGAVDAAVVGAAKAGAGTAVGGAGVAAGPVGPAGGAAGDSGTAASLFHSRNDPHEPQKPAPCSFSVPHTLQTITPILEPVTPRRQSNRTRQPFRHGEMRSWVPLVHAGCVDCAG